MTLAKSHVFRSSGDTLFAQTELLTGIKTINLNLSSNHVVLPEIVTLSERKLPSSCTDWKSFSSVKSEFERKTKLRKRVNTGPFWISSDISDARRTPVG